MQHERFHYKTLEDVKAKADELGVKLPFAADTHALTEPLKVQGVTFHNRMGIAPMEGADSTPEKRIGHDHDAEPSLLYKQERWLEIDRTVKRTVRPARLAEGEVLF